MLSLGGNNRAWVFFEQHGWTGGTNIKEKYTSRAAELYRQLLSEDAAFTIAGEKGLSQSSFGDDINATEALNDCSAEKDNDNGISNENLFDANTGYYINVAEYALTHTQRGRGDMQSY